MWLPHHYSSSLQKPAPGWNWYRDENPVPTNPFTDDLATTPCKVVKWYQHGRNRALWASQDRNMSVKPILDQCFLSQCPTTGMHKVVVRCVLSCGKYIINSTLLMDVFFKKGFLYDYESNKYQLFENENTDSCSELHLSVLVCD